MQRFLRKTSPDPLLVVAVNRSDEARRFGVAIDADGLGEALGLPVLAVSARRHQGIRELIARMDELGQDLNRPGLSDQRREADLDLALQKVPSEQVEALLAGHVQLPPRLLNRRTRRIDRVLHHPLWAWCCFCSSCWRWSSCSARREPPPRILWAAASTGSRARAWSPSWPP